MITSYCLKGYLMSHLLGVALSLRWLGLSSTLAWLEKTAHHLPLPSLALSPQQLASSVAELPGPFSCLVRACVLWWLLQRQAVVAELRIGVCIYQGVLFAHAWVEHAGIPLYESPAISHQFPPFRTNIVTTASS